MDSEVNLNQFTPASFGAIYGGGNEINQDSMSQSNPLQSVQMQSNSITPSSISALGPSVSSTNVGGISNYVPPVKKNVSSSISAASAPFQAMSANAISQNNNIANSMVAKGTGSIGGQQNKSTIQSFGNGTNSISAPTIGAPQAIQAPTAQASPPPTVNAPDSFNAIYGSSNMNSFGSGANAVKIPDESQAANTPAVQASSLPSSVNVSGINGIDENTPAPAAVAQGGTTATVKPTDDSAKQDSTDAAVVKQGLGLGSQVAQDILRAFYLV